MSALQYNSDIPLHELSVGEDTKRIGWGTFFKGDQDAWNVWNSEVSRVGNTNIRIFISFNLSLL